jgi:hypothetical protein
MSLGQVVPPTGQPTLTITYLGGPHLLAVHLAPLPGTKPLDSRGDYGYALYRGIMPQGGATLEQAAGVKHCLMKEPLSGDELLHYRFTRWKMELIAIDIKNKDGDILPFLYELFTKFDHDLNPHDKSICLKPIQRNTEIMRDAVKELIERYAEKNATIRQLNKIFAQMADGEYFMIIVNHKPDHNEMYERYAVLMKMNFSDFDIEKHMREGAELFKNI